MKKVVVFLLLSLVLSSCQLGRFVFWNFADADDYKKFHNAPIKKSDEIFYYPAYPDNSQANSEVSFPEPYRERYIKNMRKSKTQAIIIIRNDSILMEEYFGDNNRETIVTSFSIAKSFVSALIGIAIDEGYIKSTNDFMVDYLPWMKDKGMDSIRIQHLLDMKSGIRFRENYSNPSAEIAKLYYGRNLKKIVSKFKVESEPGGDFDYSSGDTQILGLILESATGKSLADYMEQKIWQPMGAEADASWSLDSKKHKTAKAFCGINARAIDFAKFGSLYLHNGAWNGKQIVPEEWVEGTLKMKPDSAYRSKASRSLRYHNQWWAYDKGRQLRDTVLNNTYYSYAYLLEPDDMRMAQGILGQYIIIWPSENIVVLRFGEKDKFPWYWYLRKLAEQNTLKTESE